MGEPGEEVPGLEGGGVWAKPMAVAASRAEDCLCPPPGVSYLSGGGSAGVAGSGEPQAVQRKAPFGFCAKHEGQTMGPPPPSRQPELSATWERFGNNKIELSHLLLHPRVRSRVVCRWIWALDRAEEMLWSGSSCH